MDHCGISAGAFDKLADRYREKYMDLAMYDEFYREFCDLLPQGRACVLDAACGPGNVSRYVMAQRPEMDLMGIDLAPRMVELARAAVPSAQFVVHDLRQLAELKRRFNGIICAFGLPYLSGEEALAFIKSAGEFLEPNGAFYLSTMLGRSEDSGLERCSSGDQVYVTYYTEEQLVGWLQDAGFTVVRKEGLASPSAAPKSTTDLIVIARN